MVTDRKRRWNGDRGSSPASPPTVDSVRRQNVKRTLGLHGIFFIVVGLYVSSSLVFLSLPFPCPLPSLRHETSLEGVIAPPPPYQMLPEKHTSYPDLAVSHFPSHCLPWPGEDQVVEGGYVGYRLLLSLQKSAQMKSKADSHPSLLCLWDLQPNATSSPMDVATYLHSKCQSLWVMYSGNKPSNLQYAFPSIRLWSSSERDHFLENLREEAKKVDWLLILPDNLFVIFQLLESQLRPLSPMQPISVPAGLLFKPNAKKAVGRIPDILCPGYVYSANSVQALEKLPLHTSLTESLLESLRLKNFDCPISDETPFTFVDTSNYESVGHWRRLHSLLNGHCDEFWNKPLGARDENGKWGYVHDPTLLRQRAPLFNRSDLNCEAEGLWYDRTRFALKKIEISPEHPEAKRVLCMVYTHSNNHDQLRSIAETWGRRCDGFLAASNKTDRSIGAVDLWHEGPEIYENMWLKVRSMWEYVFEHYADRYDFFHIGGDDHFVVAENLRWTLSTGNAKGPWRQSQPLYLGGSLAQGPHRRYCGGGSGYTLNRAALLLLKSVWNEPNCFPHWRGPDEDILMAKCFRIKSLQCMDTNDELDETRYHPWDAAYHGFWNHKQKANWIPRLLQQQGIAQKENMGQISSNSVSFHLKQPRPNPILPDDSGMRFYFALLYKKC